MQLKYTYVIYLPIFKEIPIVLLQHVTQKIFLYIGVYMKFGNRKIHNYLLTKTLLILMNFLQSRIT